MSKSIVDSLPAENSLTHQEATQRAKDVGKIHYDVKLSLKKGSETYEGLVEVNFNFVGQSGTWLDFIGKEIHELKLNGVDLIGSANENLWRANRIVLDQSKLQQNAPNKLLIKYTNNYDHGGQGFHQFVDPVDKEEYIYSNFEPFDAHKLFPCFDQPSLKATYSVEVTAPSNWQVIANYGASSSEQLPNDLTHHKFKTTLPFSTYIFAVVAGPYDHFHDTYTDASNTSVPLGAFCRKSLTSSFDYQEIFTITKQGLQFYNDFFQVPFPFDKYDQVFVPEFNWGAMENVGAVVFTEHYVFRETPTTTQLQGRADTILHEMAHMWFGNLVTPIWWSELWLNESFATYTAALAVSLATKYGQSSWNGFNGRMKSWAYREDQLPTTHPIQNVVNNTTESFLNFDGITYGKGASVLKQLVSVLTLDNFREGMRIYFKEFQWKNTNIVDFLGALQKGADKDSKLKVDLKSWGDEWLNKTGLNILQPRLQYSDDGTLTKFEVLQSAVLPEHPTLRRHRIEIGVYDLNQDSSEVVLRGVIPFTVENKPVTEVSLSEEVLKNKPRPAFIWLNFGDHAYAKIMLDDSSVQFAKDNLEKIKDPFVRQLIWSALYDMTRDANGLTSFEYLELVRSKIVFEKERRLIQTILGRAEGVIGGFIPKDYTKEESAKIYDLCFEHLQKATEEEDKIIWGRSLLAATKSKETVEKLLDVMDGKTSIGTWKLEQDTRWSIVVKAVGYDVAGAQQRVEAEKARDPSDKGQRSILLCESSKPDIEVKRAKWKRFLELGTGKESLHAVGSEIGGWKWSHQRELLKEFDEEFFNNARRICREKQKEYGGMWLGLGPDDAENDEIVGKWEQLLASCEEQDSILERAVKEELDDMKRARKCLLYAMKSRGIKPKEGSSASGGATSAHTDTTTSVSTDTSATSTTATDPTPASTSTK
eukprot:TRINITY_DN570_c0_g3_i1.p1 TRINITY_DN570_c0_g3~~TRINITY_DN570_c0_g3_i1.p1  ORF type:complete len:931 (-),score=217.68 TRINITY_DN570_c0_g3_i1:16-2808(-)